MRRTLLFLDARAHCNPTWSNHTTSLRQAGHIWAGDYSETWPNMLWNVLFRTKRRCRYRCSCNAIFTVAKKTSTPISHVSFCLTFWADIRSLSEEYRRLRNYNLCIPSSHPILQGNSTIGQLLFRKRTPSLWIVLLSTPSLQHSSDDGCHHH